MKRTAWATLIVIPVIILAIPGGSRADVVKTLHKTGKGIEKTLSKTGHNAKDTLSSTGHDAKNTLEKTGNVPYKALKNFFTGH